MGPVHPELLPHPPAVPVRPVQTGGWGLGGWGGQHELIYSHGRQLSAFNQADVEGRKVGGAGRHLAFAETSRTNRIKGVCDVISQGDMWSRCEAERSLLNIQICLINNL